MTATRFSVRTAIAVVGLLLLGAVLVRLGVWQLHRADENRALAEQFAAGSDELPLSAPPDALTEANRFHRVEVRGTYAAAPQFLLDNMLHDGVAGYHVLTVLRLEGSAGRVIVNRGWVGAGSDRNALPDVSVETEPRSLTGRIERLPRPALQLAPERSNLPATETLRVVEYPTMTRLSELLGQPLFDYQLLLDPGEPGGYARDWQAPGMDPNRNLIYAGQWLLLGIGALGASVTLAIRMLRRQP